MSSRKYEKSGESGHDYSSGNKSRSQEQKDEKLPVEEKIEAPQSRYQNKQQDAPVSEAQNVDVSNGTGFKKKELSDRGSQVKQAVAARVATSDADFAGVGLTSPSRMSLKTMAFSGNDGTIIGSAANVPSVSKSDRDPNVGRFERKLDAPNKKINYLASEQVIEEYDTPEPLGSSGNEKQGYYGTPKNLSARSQKATGAHPGDPLFERSLDLITRDQIHFINGQFVRQAGVQFDDTPTLKSTFVNGVRVESAYNLKPFGNYLPTAIEVDLTQDSSGTYVSRFKINTVRLDDASGYSSQVVNRASTHHRIFIDKAEIARQMMDDKAGRETETTWSPLGRAVLQPTQTSALLTAIEGETGATVFTGYKFASKAHAFQLNKAAKDGQHVTRPIREMLTGDIAPYLSSEDFAAGGKYNFNPLDNTAAAKMARQQGSAATMILLNDSAGKYSSKGAILTSPKSLRQYFQVADNNMDVFRIPAEFAAVLNNADVFSTIDRDYDPLLPVCLTDRVGLVYTVDPDDYCSFTRASSTAAKLYTGAGPLEYSYANRSSNYVVVVEHPLWEGIAQFIEQHAVKLYDVLGGSGNGTITWKIPVHHSTMNFALFDFLIMASTMYMERKRINSMRDVIDFETNFGYPFDLKALREVNPRNAVNYDFVSIDEPLKTKRMIASQALTWCMPEFYWGIGEDKSGSNGQYVVKPWYFNEQENLPTHSSSGHNTGSVMREYGDCMTMPIIRSGVRLAYADVLYGMSERDVRLCLDRIVHEAGTFASTADAYSVYKYSQVSDGIAAAKYVETGLQSLQAVRELGLYFVDRSNVLRMRDALVNTTANTAAGAYYPDGITATLAANATTSTTYRAYSWCGRVNYDAAILAQPTVNINRAQAFEQVWNCSPATRMLRARTSEGHAGTPKARRDLGFALAMNEIVSLGTGNSAAFLLDNGYFHPFTTGLNSGGQPFGAQVQLSSGVFACIGIAKALWGRIQKLPMALSPWDTCDFDGEKGAQFDPYDLMYAFGMAGTYASDYSQDTYDRINKVQADGWLYVTDPFIADSPILKDGASYTM